MQVKFVSKVMRLRARAYPWPRVVFLTQLFLFFCLFSSGYFFLVPSLLPNPLLRSASAQSSIPDELIGVGITEHLGKRLSLETLHFQDERGENKLLSSYFLRGKPVLLALVYYKCPNLCNFMLNGLLKSLNNMSWTVGDQFELVAVSINPAEKPALASRKKEAYLAQYRPTQELGKTNGRSGSSNGAGEGWHFLTGQQDQIEKLAQEVGFGYRYDEKQKEYAHSAALFILTPEGSISRYLYGIEYAVKDLKLALLEASDGKIGTVVDRFLLFCFHYDPQARKYSLYTMRVMQCACVLTTLLIGFYLAIFWQAQRKGLESR